MRRFETSLGVIAALLLSTASIAYAAQKRTPPKGGRTEAAELRAKDYEALRAMNAKLLRSFPANPFVGIGRGGVLSKMKRSTQERPTHGEALRAMTEKLLRSYPAHPFVGIGRDGVPSKMKRSTQKRPMDREAFAAWLDRLIPKSTLEGRQKVVLVDHVMFKPKREGFKQER